MIAWVGNCGVDNRSVAYQCGGHGGNFPPYWSALDFYKQRRLIFNRNVN